jgi:hypothetical protein
LLHRLHRIRIVLAELVYPHVDAAANMPPRTLSRFVVQHAREMCGMLKLRLNCA